MWYDTGTVSVTNGSTTVTGSGTNFVSGAQVGEAFYGPDDNLYEIQAIVSATQLTLADAYLGSTQSGQAYKIIPTQSLVADLASQVTTLINDYQTVADEAGEGKFDDGSAASPGITFTQDQDTGFFRETANEIGISVGGSKIGEFSSSAFDIDLPITGTAVQSSATDSTAGRLLTVGAFGLGQSEAPTPLNDDCNDEVRNGRYETSITTANTPSAVSGSGVLLVNARDPTRVSQTFYKLDGTTVGTVYHRFLHSTWSDWAIVYDSGTILGTVSQSGGTPTGSVIERGSNANGEYVRFADGTQICTKTVTGLGPINNTYGSAFASGSISLGSFAATFSSTPSVSFSAANPSGTSSSVDGSGITGTTAFNAVFLVRQTSSASTDFIIYGTAVGRWF